MIAITIFMRFHPLLVQGACPASAMTSSAAWMADDRKW